MKSRFFQMPIALSAGVVLLWGAASGLNAAEIVAAEVVTKPAEVTATPAPLSVSANEVLKLVHAKLNEETIVAYIAGSSTPHRLTATEIISLRSQGVSERIITAMLVHQNENRGGPGRTAPPQYATEAGPTPAPGQAVNPDGSPAVANPTVVVQAPPTYVETEPNYVPYYDYPVSPVYPPVYSSYYSYYPYYPYYSYYGYRSPGVSLAFGFGRGYHGGAFHGGNHFVGGGFHGPVGGGFHGGPTGGGFHGGPGGHGGPVGGGGGSHPGGGGPGGGSHGGGGGAGHGHH